MDAIFELLRREEWVLDGAALIARESARLLGKKKKSCKNREKRSYAELIHNCPQVIHKAPKLVDNSVDNLSARAGKPQNHADSSRGSRRCQNSDGFGFWGGKSPKCGTCKPVESPKSGKAVLGLPKSEKIRENGGKTAEGTAVRVLGALNPAHNADFPRRGAEIRLFPPFLERKLTWIVIKGASHT